MRQHLLVIAVCLIAPAIVAQVEPTAGRSDPVLSVCTVLANRLKYDGQMLRIRGQNTGSGESSSITDTHCPGVLATEGHEWPWAIALTSPNGIKDRNVGFRFDDKSMRGLADKLAQLRPQMTSRDCLVVTVTGLFETHKEWTFTSLGTPRGFGHLNGAIAQLILKSYDDVEIAKNCGE
jgi:hypothetical protein